MAEPMSAEQGAAIVAALERIGLRVDQLAGQVSQLVSALAEDEDDGSLTPLDGGRIGAGRDMTRGLG